MISPDLLQAEVVTILRADTILIAALPENSNGVREMQWKGTAFQYPCVRVERPNLQLQSNSGACEHRVSDAVVRVSVHSKVDSSISAQQVLGLVEKALRGRTITTAALRATQLYVISMAPVSPETLPGQPSAPGEVWTGSINLRTIVSEL